MQQHYNDSQKEDEIIVAFGSRLESTLCKDIKQGQINITAKDTMFKSKFWTGLRSKSLRDSIRDVYANIKDFQILLYREIRKVEQEKTSTETFNKDAKATALHTRPEDGTEKNK